MRGKEQCFMRLRPSGIHNNHRQICTQATALTCRTQSPRETKTRGENSAGTAGDLSIDSQEGAEMIREEATSALVTFLVLGTNT